MNRSDTMRQFIPWYHGYLTRHASEVLLINNGEEGSYLLREVAPREYCVSVRGKSDVRHFKMVRNSTIKVKSPISVLCDNSHLRSGLYLAYVRQILIIQDFDGSIYHFGLEDFDSISSIVTYFANQPMIGTKRTTMCNNFEQGTLYTLKHPYPHKVPEPAG